jgi:hypothetical protein
MIKVCLSDDNLPNRADSVDDDDGSYSTEKEERLETMRPL